MDRDICAARYARHPDSKDKYLSKSALDEDEGIGTVIFSAAMLGLDLRLRNDPVNCTRLELVKPFQLSDRDDRTIGFVLRDGQITAVAPPNPGGGRPVGHAGARRA